MKPNQEITLTVQVSDAGVVLLEEQRNGIGHGDVEIEGNVGQIVALNPAGDSRFVINGRTVVARPGETAVREGNRSRNIEDVTEGRHVHVKGVWLPMEGSTQPVLAHEIKLQGDDGEDVGGTSRSGSGQGLRRRHQDRGRRPHRREVRLHHHRQPAGQGSVRLRSEGARAFARATRRTRWPSCRRAGACTSPGRALGDSGGTCRVAADEVKVQQN